MRRLIPKPLPLSPLPDTAPADLDYIIRIATAAGYALTRLDAETIWGRHCADTLCITWIRPATDTEVMTALEQQGQVLELPDPPEGYASWLDYAVATMDTRSVDIARVLDDVAPAVTREQMREAVQLEYQSLLKRAGQG
ncbi:hypothetical protein [Dechloromonas hortensis]|uniref:hypothetical protein n=1 Tax=Dechloromonas hortensis TaxID=337779 RepID=UPI0012913109|nr:hypothetical protein [Dechloromonas hortensis]